ncbi:hypothetical protein FFM54_27710 [Burkholderia pseudomallei]|nr:hypothetical protein FFM54_27710 [Burkholderia pseudomallei]
MALAPAAAAAPACGPAATGAALEAPPEAYAGAEEVRAAGPTAALAANCEAASCAAAGGEAANAGVCGTAAAADIAASRANHTMRIWNIVEAGKSKGSVKEAARPTSVQASRHFTFGGLTPLRYRITGCFRECGKVMYRST